jgi:hypothetical protein
MVLLPVNITVGQTVRLFNANGFAEDLFADYLHYIISGESYAGTCHF